MSFFAQDYASAFTLDDMSTVDLKSFDQTIRRLYEHDLRVDMNPTWAGRCTLCRRMWLTTAHPQLIEHPKTCGQQARDHINRSQPALAMWPAEETRCTGSVLVHPHQEAVLAAFKLGGAEAVWEMARE